MSDSNRTSVALVEEVTWGTNPATALTELNYTSESLAFNINNITSETIRADRQITDLIQTGADCSGGFSFELQYGGLGSMIDLLMQAGLWAASWTSRLKVNADTGIGATNVDDTYTHTGAPGWDTLYAVGEQITISGFVNAANNGNFTIVSRTATTIVVGAGGTLVDEAATPAISIFSEVVETGDISADETVGVYSYQSAANVNWTQQGLVVGQWVRVSGFATAANNGYAEVTAIAATTLTVVGLTIVDEAAGALTITVSPCDFIKNGTTENSFYVERAHQDVTQFFQFAGMVPNTMSMTASANSVMTGNYDFVGKAATLIQATAGTGSNTASATTSVMNAVSNVGQILINGVAVTSCLMQEVSFTVNNNVRGLSSIGELGFCDVGVGSAEITGTINAYFKDETFYDLYLASTAFTLSFKVADSAGNTYVVSFGNCKLESDALNSGGLNTDIVENMGFRAILDSTVTNCQIQISRHAA